MAAAGAPVAQNVKGTVSWFSLSRGYGYIKSDQFSNVFVHRSQVDPSSLNFMSTNPEVIFDAYSNERGWKAYKVSIVTKKSDLDGFVKWFNHERGFGYISHPDGDVKVVRRDLTSGLTISGGSHVKFDLEVTARYRKARNVRFVYDEEEPFSVGIISTELHLSLLSVTPESSASPLNNSHASCLNSSTPAVQGADDQPSASSDPFTDIVGSVTFWNRRRNFGFIKCPQGKVYVNRSALRNGYNFLDRGDIVTFDIESSVRGFKASNVRYIPDDLSQDLDHSDESEYGATAAFISLDDLYPDLDYLSSSSSDILPPYFITERVHRRRNRSRGLSNIASGYDSSRFVDKNIPQQLICPICLGVFNDPVSAPCEHAFCKGCIYRWLREDDLCPVDRHDLDEDDLKPLPLLLRGILGQLRIRCAHEGCDSIVNLDDIKDHEDKCSYKDESPKNCCAEKLT